MSRPSRSQPAKRIQYAALPYRIAQSHTEVMLITSRETGRWVIPKGWPGEHQRPCASAAREAREEAGIVGDVGPHPIGSYTYQKRLKNGAVVLCEVLVFPLKVERQQKHWREKGQRQAQWFSPAEAAEIVQERRLRNLLRRFPTRKPLLSKSWNRTSGAKVEAMD
jgi:8-oxo-dGTP pyrophosphatase MutT (NUDIX family)